MVKVHFEIPSFEKIAEFIYDLKDTLDKSTLKQRSSLDCIFVELKPKLKKELFELNHQRLSGRVEKPGRFKMIRKEIARILTVINEREKHEVPEISRGVDPWVEPYSCCQLFLCLSGR